jgi:hypothetical protein
MLARWDASAPVMAPLRSPLVVVVVPRSLRVLRLAQHLVLVLFQLLGLPCNLLPNANALVRVYRMLKSPDSQLCLLNGPTTEILVHLHRRLHPLRKGSNRCEKRSPSLFQSGLGLISLQDLMNCWRMQWLQRTWSKEWRRSPRRSRIFCTWSRGMAVVVLSNNERFLYEYLVCTYVGALLTPAVLQSESSAPGSSPSDGSMGSSCV